MNSVLACQDAFRVDIVQIDPVFWPQNAKQATQISDNANVYKMSPSNNSDVGEKETKSRFSHIEEGLESSLSKEAQNTINRIVSEVKSLSDVEKLFLYLKLPTGDSCKDLRKTPTSVGIQKPNRTQQAQTYTWIKSHLEEDEQICLPKQDVYEDYKWYCETHDIKALSTADFGKLMKSVFPNVKPRRLGQRGQSRYCYGGLRKKLDVQPPTLPELEIAPTTTPGNEDDEIHTASCQLVCEWAHKLLNANFQGIKDLAEYLISNLCVNSKSVAAFTVIAAMEDAGIQNIKEPSLFSNITGGDRRRETQMLLQRKIQEGKLLREQKKKLQQQREENELKLKECQDRQTPFITSPSVHVMKSPAKRLFEDSNIGRSKSVQGKVLQSQAFIVEQKNSEKNERSKSISDADVEMISVEKEPSLQSIKKVQSNISEPKIDKQTKDIQNVFIENPQTSVITQGIPNQARSVQVTNCVARKTEQNKDFGTIPSIDSCEIGSLNRIIQDERRTSDEVDGNRPIKKSVVSIEINPDNLSSPSHHVIRKPSVISANDWHNSPSNKNIQSVNDNSRNDNGQTNRESNDSDATTLIKTSSHSSRSAFVPFSQIHNRKEGNADMCKSPPISLTQSDGQIYVTVPNNFDITKLPSHLLEQIEQVVGPSQLVKVEDTKVSVSEITPNCAEPVSKIAFQPVVQSGIIAPSSMATSVANISTSDQVSVSPASHKALNSYVVNNSSLISQQIVAVDGKIILPANINIGGSTGIIVGQTNLPEIGKNVASLPAQVMAPLPLQVPTQSVSIPTNQPTSCQDSKMAQNLPGVVVQTESSHIQNIVIQSTSQANPNICSKGESSAVVNRSRPSLGSVVSSLLSPCTSVPITVAMPSVTTASFSRAVASHKQPVTPTTPISITMTNIPIIVSSSSSTKVVSSPCRSSAPSFTGVCSTSTTSSISSASSLVEVTETNSSNSNNPSTPKKSSKSRFVSIRPKASPVKTSSTISSILKDTKVMPSEPFVYDKSKSVSELLKEKRAREAELKNKQKNLDAQNVTGTTGQNISSILKPSGTANPQVCSTADGKSVLPSAGSFIIPAERGDGPASVKNLFAIGMPKQPTPNTLIASAEMIEKFQSGQVIPPGLIPVGKSGDIVYVINPVPQMVEKALEKSPATRPNTLCLDKDGEKKNEESWEKKKSVESPNLNDEDTMDIDDLIRMQGGKMDEVSCETPSKFAKIEDGDQIVHSRPGSRCSSEIEPPGGRKRKFLNSDGAPFRCFGRKRLNSADENDIIELDLFEENNDSRKESRSCTIEIDKGYSGIMSKTSALKQSRSQHYPDISMLEIDALVDLDKQEHPTNNHPQKIVQSASVGVNSLSWRKSQQQLLKEKSKLDQSVRTFLQKMDKHETGFSQPNSVPSPQPRLNCATGDAIVSTYVSTHLCESFQANQLGDTHILLTPAQSVNETATKSHQNMNNIENLQEQDLSRILQSSSGFSMTSDENTPMEEDSDLPKDVADFITDIVTGRISAEIESNGANYSSFDGNNQVIDKLGLKQQNMDYSEGLNRSSTFTNDLSPMGNTNTISIHSQSLPSAMLASQNLIMETNKSGSVQRFEKPTNLDEGKFASPQRPVSRRQRTPSVERTSSAVDRRSVQTPTLFPSPIHSSTMKRREPSVDRVTNQTPFSDPGYGSVGASPILNPTPVSHTLTCDTSVTSGYNSSFMSTRADSAQSIASDANMFSPVSLTISPRFQTSTPYPLQSPCPTPSRNIMQSPIDAVGPGQSFVPIQGSQLQISSNVTLIKPVVTVASSQPNSAVLSMQTREQGKLRKDLIGIGSILPRNEHSSQRPPPSYSDALLSQLQGTVDKRVLPNNKGAFNAPHQKEAVVTEDHNSSSDQVLAAPFSYKLAMMSNKYDLKKSRPSTDLHNLSLPEHLLQSNDVRHNLPLTDDEKEKSFQIESIKASLQNSSMQAPNYISNFNEQEVISDPSSQVMKPQRKFSHGRIDDHMVNDVVDDDIEFMAAKKNLSLDLEQNTSFNEDDLETTLEDLKSLDGQYFTQDNMCDFQRQ